MDIRRDLCKWKWKTVKDVKDQKQKCLNRRGVKDYKVVKKIL